MSSNDYSFHLACRQWELLDKGVHKHVFNFDKVCNYFLERDLKLLVSLLVTAN